MMLSVEEQALKHMRMLAFLSPHFQLMCEHEERQKDKIFVVPSLISSEDEYTLGKKNEYTYKKW